MVSTTPLQQWVLRPFAWPGRWFCSLLPMEPGGCSVSKPVSYPAVTGSPFWAQEACRPVPWLKFSSDNRYLHSLFLASLPPGNYAIILEILGLI